MRHLHASWHALFATVAIILLTSVILATLDKPKVSYPQLEDEQTLRANPPLYALRGDAFTIPVSFRNDQQETVSIILSGECGYTSDGFPAVTSSSIVHDVSSGGSIRTNVLFRVDAGLAPGVQLCVITAEDLIKGVVASHPFTLEIREA